MKKLCIILGLLSFLELAVIYGLYLKVSRMTSELTIQSEQIDDLETTLHQILNDRDMCEKN